MGWELDRKALHAKLAWAYVVGQSLWAKFLRSKYGHPLDVVSKPIFWFKLSCLEAHKFAPHVSTILDNSHWVVGAGNISFSMDNWGACAFSVQNVDLNTPFREVIQSADFSTLVLPSLSTEAQSILSDISLDSDIPDRLVWHHSPLLRTSASYWSFSRIHGQKSPWWSLLWNQWLSS